MLCVMAASLFVSRVIWVQFHHRYDYMPHGWFHGYLSLVVNNFMSTTHEGDETPHFMIVLKGRSENRWYSQTPTNFSYGTIEMRVGRNPALEQVIAKLPSLDYIRGGETGHLTPDLLARWIAEDNESVVDAELLAQTSWIIGCLERANQGSLPGPRHHTYRTDNFVPTAPPGIDVTFQHFLLGGGFWRLDGVFLLGIPATVLWLARRRAKRVVLPADCPE